MTIHDPDEAPKGFAYVSDLTVLTQYRGRGLARALLSRAKQYARKRGATTLRVLALSQNTVAKGINFGTVSTPADGTRDTTGISGVDEDFRIKPFFYQGGTVSIREFLIGAFKAEMRNSRLGIQSCVRLPTPTMRSR